jgi:trk system potassium uptake protein TrkH
VHYKEISRILGKYFFYFSLILLVPLCVSVYFDYIKPSSIVFPKSSLSFVVTLFISLFISMVFSFWGKKASREIFRKESILLVIIIWIVSVAIGALPFYLTNTLQNPIDAYFESMSGFTTTGATVMYPKTFNDKGKELPIYQTNINIPYKTYKYYGTITPILDQDHHVVFQGIEAVSKGILFWRSFIQWLGGMGIVVLFLAILPLLAIGGKFLFQTEVPGPIKESLTPRIKETASVLWKLYLGLTVLEIYLLIWTNPEIPLFDAFCITFSTISTGGFSVKNSSIGTYNNPYTDWIVIIFMILGSVNFSLYFYLIKRKFYRVYEPDFLFFLALIFIGALTVSFNLIGTKKILLTGYEGGIFSVSEALRYGTFQAISAQSSTGFATANYDYWPLPVQLVLLLLMFIGGMSGSTAGGFKTSRIYILYKTLMYKLQSLVHPERVKKLVIGNQEIDEKAASTVLVFFAVFIFFLVLGEVCLVFDHIDPQTALGTIACMMNNVGFGFRAANPEYSFAFLSSFSKILSILWMFLGRLEFFAVLFLFLPGFWKKN